MWKKVSRRRMVSGRTDDESSMTGAASWPSP
jgi:hypothetical protein